MRHIANFTLFLIFFGLAASAEDYGRFLDSGQQAFDSEVEQNREWVENERLRDAAEAAERRRSSDAVFSEQLNSRETQFCFAISDDNGRAACLSEPHMIDNNDDAKNVLLGNCHGLSSRADRQGYVAVCTQGKTGCLSLNNDDARNWCTQCDGTKRWLATYLTGTIIQCFR